MLVLTRKCDETIKIGEDIIIKVIQTGRGTVKLGIEAPSCIRVLRGELIEFTVASPMNASEPASVDNSKLMTTAMTASLSNLSPITPHKFRSDFDAEYVSDLEDQLLVATAS